MPVPWDRLPPTCQGPRPHELQEPMTASFSAATAQESLPDLQADSAMEDEIDGFNFAAIDLAPTTQGAIPGIFPINLNGSRTVSTTFSSVVTSDQLGLYAYPRLDSGYNSVMHPSGSSLTSQLNTLAIDDSVVSDTDIADTGHLRSRGLSNQNALYDHQWLPDVHPQILTTARQPNTAPHPPYRIRSPPQLPSDEEDIYTDTRDDKSDQCNSNRYTIWFEVDTDGDTPLLLAIIHLATEQALHFIRSVPSADLLDHRNLLQQSALHLAVLTHQPVVVRSLVVTGATLDIRDRNGNTALHLCCKQGDVDSATALTTPIDTRERNPLSSNVPLRKIPQDLSILNYDGESCLHVAAISGHLSVLKYLLSKRHIKANPNIADGKSGRTILHYAVEARDVPLVSFLMARSDVRIDSRTFDGTTALSIAVGRQYMDIANLLITAGANSELVHLSDSDSDCECAFMEDDDRVNAERIT